MSTSDDTPDASAPLSTADSLRRALAMKKKGASGPGIDGGLNKKPQEKMRAAQATAANKPAFRKASKRG